MRCFDESAGIFFRTASGRYDHHSVCKLPRTDFGNDHSRFVAASQTLLARAKRGRLNAKSSIRSSRSKLCLLGGAKPGAKWPAIRYHSAILLKATKVRLVHRAGIAAFRSERLLGAHCGRNSLPQHPSRSAESGHSLRVRDSLVKSGRADVQIRRIADISLRRHKTALGPNQTVGIAVGMNRVVRHIEHFCEQPGRSFGFVEVGGRT